MFLLRGAVGLGFVGMGTKLWQMQIAKGSDYEDVAEGNILRFERLKSARGRILDRRGAVLAENRRAWTVKVIPSLLPEDPDEQERVLRMVSDTLKLGEVLALDRTLIPLGSEASVVNALEERLGVDKEALMAELSRTGTTMVLLKDDLSPEEAEQLLAEHQDVPGLRALNLIDFQLATHPAGDLALTVKEDADRDTALTIGSNAILLPGVTVDDKALIRQYSGSPSFSHILGYVGPISEDEYGAARTATGTPIYDPDDRVGRGGIEESIEQELRGTKGGRWLQVDSQGVERFELTDRRRDPIPGLSAQLTLDRDFQNAVTDALQEGIEFADREAKEDGREPVGAGVAIAINPQNGEILAMASLPNFDNQLFVDGISQAQYEVYQNDEYTPLINRAISGTYAPGSTFKPLVACMGLQEGVVNTETTFICKGRFTVPWSWDETQGNDYLCWVGTPGHGPVDIYHAISDSCDVFFYNVGAPRDKPDEEEFPNADWLHYYNPGDTERHYFNGLGIDRIANYLSGSFGFGKASGIELAGEATGLVPTPNWLRQQFEGQFWSVGDTINVSIGQGHLLCTPLQLANATAAIANGGTLWQPRVLKALLREDGQVAKEFPAREINKLNVAPEHLDTVREGMRRTITEGTGMGKITLDDPQIAGKSGTAEFGVAVDGLYAQSHAWFTAFGPYENPEIAVAVLIVNGDAGSTYAGPVVNKILHAYFDKA